MSFNQDDEVAPWDVAGSTSNAASNTEDPNDSSDHRQSLWAADVGDRGHPAATATSPHWLAQMSSIAENLSNDTQEESGHLESSFSPMDTDTSLSEWLEGGGILGHGDEARPIENNDDAGLESASTRIESTQRIAPQAPFFTGIPSPTQGSKDVFLQNILNRHGGRHEALGPYTDGLLERVGSSDHGSESHVGTDMYGLTASYPHEWSMLPNQMEIVSPSLEDIRRQQEQGPLDLDQTGDHRGVAGEGAFVFMDENHFDSLPR
ncbi:hypothetical protein E8E13_000452 [Curvularia kusanoi]|uniref:Uncharacterized protein n=1 Tax=Curvularia kusanoi TaxID=90978 RepID=A0A9P4T7Q6_CURKU|nr:hypothetical protein E8E13_000452 [Curvularia kusanoi]